MPKTLTCIECPTGCIITVDIDNGRVVKVAGHRCPRGEEYAKAEIENPTRILTSSVLSAGLSLKMIPVRTDRPIPKAKLFAAMQEIKKVRVTTPVCFGETIVSNFLNLGVNLIATREVKP